MNWKEIFKPTIGKLILPIVLCLLFLIMLISTYSLTNKVGSTACTASRDYIVPLTRAQFTNNTAEVIRLSAEFEVFNRERRFQSGKEKFIEASAIFFSTINPFYNPLLDSNSKYTYLKKEHFNCVKESFEDLETITGESGATGYQALFYQNEYKPVPWIFHIFGFIVLFLEGYVLSILASFIYKKIKKNEI